MDADQLREEYTKRFDKLTEVADILDQELHELLKGLPRIDSISARPKSINRFIEKAFRPSKTYLHPLQDIQDQIGARVVVFYLSDVKAISEKIIAEFRVIENRIVEEDIPSSFSYRAQHFICSIPPDVRIKTQVPIDFFELQVSTLFQHAWSEANHDLVYKAVEAKDYDERKRVAWAAAQAWGADRIFDELWEDSKPKSTDKS